MSAAVRSRGFRRSAGFVVALALGAIAPASGRAQSLPPIYAGAAIETAEAATVVEFPRGSFLENLAIDPQGTLFVTSYLDGKVYRIDSAGKPGVWASIDGTVAGIALNPDGTAVVSGWIKGKEPAVFLVDRQGRSEVLCTLPGGLFPNGVVRLADQRFLVADSYRGAIWVIDAAARSARIWLEHELLGRADNDNPTPAVNGIKLFGGALYASNTARQTLIKVPVIDGRAGTPAVLLKEIGIDDFDFDAGGRLYGATHVYNSLVRVDPNGAVTVLAGVTQGMAGSTAVVARPSAAGIELLVTTNGGMSLPPAGGVQPGRVVRLTVRPKP